jgi:hypothetical protein
MAKKAAPAPKNAPDPAILTGSADPIFGALTTAERKADVSKASVEKASDLVRYVQVLDPAGIALRPMEAWPLALELMDRFWPTHKRTVIKKARQMGVSWDFALYCLWHMGWKSYRTVGSVNYTQQMAGELINRMRVLWQTMPANLRPPLRKGTDWSVEKVEFANGSKCVALATKDVSGAGLTFSMLGIDEAGLIENLGENWAALLPAVEFGELHIFSTPRSETAKYAELIKACIAGDTTFTFRDIHWSERPGRDEAWKAARIAEIGPQKFDREYGGIFSRPGACYFDDDTIKLLRKLVLPPVETALGGRLRIYVTPQEFARAIATGDTAVIGADVAEGTENGDFSVAQVLSRRTGRQLATFHGRVGVTEFAEILVKLAKMYGNAWLGIEANNHGHAVCQWVYRHLRYRRVHRESLREQGAVGVAPRSRLGILTTESSKPAMLAELEDGVRKQTLHICDAATIEELSTFISLPGGGYGAAPGMHDDCVMSLAIAQNCRGRACPVAF